MAGQGTTGGGEEQRKRNQEKAEEKEEQEVDSKCEGRKGGEKERTLCGAVRVF